MYCRYVEFLRDDRIAVISPTSRFANDQLHCVSSRFALVSGQFAKVRVVLLTLWVISPKSRIGLSSP